MKTILLGGLNASGLRFFEVVSLNGTSTITTTNQFSQIDIADSASTGTGGGATGTITITGNTDTVTYGTVVAGENAWRSGRIFTDTASTGYIDTWGFGSYLNAARGSLRCNHLSGNLYALIPRATCITQNDTIDSVFPVPIKIPKQGMAAVYGVAKQSNTEVTTSFIVHLAGQ